MAFFKKIGNFLSKPAVRIGAAALGAAAGLGAFKDMDDIAGLRPELLAGGLNIASGGASLANKKGSPFLSVAQMGLGGYNVAQGLGMVDSIPGMLGHKTSPVVIEETASSGGGGFSYQTPERAVITSEPLPPLIDPAARNAGGALPGPGIPRPDPAPAARWGGGADLPSVTEVEYGNIMGGPAATGTPSAIAKLPMPPTPRPTDVLAGSNGTDILRGSAGTDVMPGSGPSLGTLTPTQVAAVSAPEGSRVLGQITPAGVSNVLSAAPLPNVQPGGGTNVQAPGDFFSRATAWLGKKIDENPLNAVMAGAMLTSMFQTDPAEKAAKEYAAKMAEYEASLDPSKPPAQTYMNGYKEQRAAQLDEAYQKAVGDFQVLMSQRGLTDSDLYTKGLAQLKSQYDGLKSNLDFEAQNAWMQFQSARFGVMRQASATAATGPQITAQTANPVNFAALGYTLGGGARR